MKRCHKCGTEWASEKRKPGVKEFCSKCTAYLHCCMNCRFHDRHAHNECYIPKTEWVADRAGCNFCDEFEFADTEPGDGPGPGDAKKAKARDALRTLFVDGGDDAPAKNVDDFKKLFGD